MQVSSIRIQLFSAFIFVLASCSSNPKISFESLLSDLVDRDKLARFPSPDFTVAQFSSYDRNMVQPGDSTWFANWDRSMFLRVEEHNGHQEYVMMDTSCAGAIVRFWMTFSGENSGKGILRIYLDGSENPVIEGPAVDILSGKLLIDGILASSVSDSTDYSMRGHNLYLPIPFGKGCKVTYESENIKDFGAKTGGESVYYNINYRKYQDAKVETFTLEQLVIHKQKLMEVQEELKSRKNDLEHLQVMKHEIKKTVNPGDSISWKLSGAQSAIRQITFKVESENLEQALRSTIVKLTFDGNLTVWTPLGDFFGTGYQIRPSHTWYTEVTKDGQMTCQWVMPYVDQVEMTILNIGTSPVFVNGLISTSDWDWDERSMYFGASWHQYSNLFTGEMKNMGGGGGPFDINFITLHGKGVYVGDAVTLFNTVYAWWGEGDEKVYVDGEPFPSHIGTGTEDYYGYAWCRPELITSHPFISQPDGSGNFDPGYTVNMRVRNLDAIPFNQQLKFDMEMWHWTRSHINFAPITFFYLHPDGIQPVVPDVENARENVVLKREDLISPFISNGTVEGENMIYSGSTGGRFRYQNSTSPGWSKNMQIYWSDVNANDSLELRFMAETAGEYEVAGIFTLGPVLGEFDWVLNGVKMKDVLNLNRDLEKVSVLKLGKYPILKGENTLVISARKNISGKTSSFSLDYLTFN